MTTKIRKLSKKRAKQNREYRKIEILYLIDNPFCARCNHPSTQVHHMKGRIGTLLTETRYFLAVCMLCHQWIELHPKEAKELGYSLSRL